MEYRLRRHDGEYRWVLDAGVPFFIPDGSFGGYIGSCVDITERRHAEDAVRRKEMELRESQRLAGVGSWRWDPDTDTVQWSEELYHLSGRYPRLGAVSYKDHGTLYAPEGWVQLQRAVEEALRTGASYRARSRDDSRRSARASGSRRAVKSSVTPPAASSGSAAPSRTLPSASSVRTRSRCSAA